MFESPAGKADAAASNSLHAKFGTAPAYGSRSVLSIQKKRRQPQKRFYPGQNRFWVHKFSLALLLLVLDVLADHHDGALAANDLALFAHRLNRRSDLHVV